jgi:hypothetical protein
VLDYCGLLCHRSRFHASPVWTLSRGYVLFVCGSAARTESRGSRMVAVRQKREQPRA